MKHSIGLLHFLFVIDDYLLLKSKRKQQTYIESFQKNVNNC